MVPPLSAIDDFKWFMIYAVFWKTFVPLITTSIVIVMVYDQLTY